MKLSLLESHIATYVQASFETILTVMFGTKTSTFRTDKTSTTNGIASEFGSLNIPSSNIVSRNDVAVFPAKILNCS